MSAFAGWRLPASVGEFAQVIRVISHGAARCANEARTSSIAAHLVQRRLGETQPSRSRPHIEEVSNLRFDRWYASDELSNHGRLLVGFGLINRLAPQSRRSLSLHELRSITDDARAKGRTFLSSERKEVRL